MDKQWWVNIVAVRGGPGPSSSTSRMLPLLLPSRVCWSCRRGAASSLSARMSLSPHCLRVSCHCVVSVLSCPCCIAGPCHRRHRPCPGCIVVPCCRSVVGLCLSRVGWDERRGYLQWCPNNDDEQRIRRSSFGCHVADGDMAPAFRVRGEKGGGK